MALQKGPAGIVRSVRPGGRHQVLAPDLDQPAPQNRRLHGPGKAIQGSEKLFHT